MQFLPAWDPALEDREGSGAGREGVCGRGIGGAGEGGDGVLC